VLVPVPRQVGADKAIQIANYLCPGNYAVSGSIEGCEAVERLGKDPAFKARMTVSHTATAARNSSHLPAALWGYCWLCP
jgi:[acyl-carrier-protein] S-malonyltransferase